VELLLAKDLKRARLVTYEPLPDGRARIRVKQNIDRVLDYCREMQADPWRSRDGIKRNFQHVATVPAYVKTEWALREGFDADAPENQAEVMRRLNSSEYAHLRTAPGKI
jgi:hypothetical protein